MLSLWRSAGTFTLCHPWPRGFGYGVITTNFHVGFFRGNINQPRVIENLLKCSHERVQPEMSQKTLLVYVHLTSLQLRN